MALGVGYGVCLALLPKTTPLWLFLFLLVFILRVNLIVTFSVFIVSLGLNHLIHPLFEKIGFWLLVDVGFLRPVWSFFYHAPLLPYLQLNNSYVLGSSIVCLFVVPLSVYLAARMIPSLREAVRIRVRQTYFWRALTTQRPR